MFIVSQVYNVMKHLRIKDTLFCLHGEGALTFCPLAADVDVDNGAMATDRQHDNSQSC